MDIRSILVNVDLDVEHSTALRCAMNLAAEFSAELIAVAADEPNMTFVGLDGGSAAADFYSLERTEIEKRLHTAEAQMRAALPAGVKLDWRAFVGSPVRAILDNARRADLIVTASATTATFQARRRVDLGELVLGAGRPVIDVADGVTKVKSDKIVIAWKDTREARRAVADALPFLRKAQDVVALTVSEGDTDTEQASLDDLLAWLRQHDVKARGEIIANKEGFIDVLESAARAYEADLLVAGGYGHSRMREWLFGGVTRNLLQANTLNRFLSN